MRPPVSTGDLALVAQPAVPETFAPYGRLLADGARGYLGKRGRVLTVVDERRPGVMRIDELLRYPEAKRAIIPLGRAPMWVVVRKPGETPSGPPDAFLVPEGVGLLLREGVWHAGPFPTAPLRVCELLETRGTADRLDRRHVSDLCGVGAVRVEMPEDPAARAPALDLGAPGVVLVDAELQGRVRVGLLVIAGVRLDRTPGGLAVELEGAAKGVRALWAHATDLRQVPGIAQGRDLYRACGMDPVRSIPPAEALYAQVLGGHAVPADDPLRGTLALCGLRHPLPLSAVDVGTLGSRLVLRVGTAADGRLETRGRPTKVAGRPLLCTADGRPLAAPFGQDGSAWPAADARSLLVAAWFPPTADTPGIEAVLEGVGRTLETHLGGSLEARRVVG